MALFSHIIATEFSDDEGYGKVKEFVEETARQAEASRRANQQAGRYPDGHTGKQGRQAYRQTYRQTDWLPKNRQGARWMSKRSVRDRHAG